jgi:2-polyprenyl-3-methyl-5-hydroxy-6-metoxy-1,4-benzoquinol methylase
MLINNSNQMSADAISEQRDKFVERLLQSTSGVFDVFSIYIGHRLGFYDALAKRGVLTSEELASHTKTNERCAREWLEQQTVAGILEVEDETAEATARRFSLPPGHAEVLVDRWSLNYLSPLVRLVAGAVRPLDSILNAYRTGDGVPYEDYGIDLREGQASMNRAMFLEQLGQEWLRAMPDVCERLQEDPPACVADVGCGAGWSSIGIAREFPKVRVDGFDLDSPSIDLARENAASAALSERVNFHVRNAGDPQLAGRYDLVTAFECIHDMSNPVDALRAMRNLLTDRGAGLVVDERVGDAFTAKGGEDFEWMMYGWSVLHCLLVGMADKPSAETGTVMRSETFRRYATEAGFSSVEILPIDHFFFRFYRLNP